MSRLSYAPFYRRRLPHLQPPGATLFITFRLTGSLPRSAIDRLLDEARTEQRILAQIADPRAHSVEEGLLERRLFGKWDSALNAATTGPVWLSDLRIAGLTAASLHHRDGRVLRLDAYCIMPNHVHLVCSPLQQCDGTYHSLPAIMHSLKLHVALEGNRLLGRQGTFWQHESYDHVVRDEPEWRRIVNYVLNNPVSAGLADTWEDWEWNYVRPEGP